MSFNLQEPSAWSSFGNALLATALFRCWHILIFFGAWSTAICVISRNVYNLAFQPTLITVFGTVLGFVISYRTTASFERYNEGRRLWSQIVLGSRTFARTVWLHIPDQQQEEYKAKTLIEKKSAVNLLEAFAVADLYYLVRFLPTHKSPTIPSAVDLNRITSDDVPASPRSGQFHGLGLAKTAPAPGQLPLSTTAPISFHPEKTIPIDGRPQESVKLPMGPDIRLAPAMNPPKYSLLDLFPFSILVWMLTKDGVNKNGEAVKGRKAARRRATMRNHRGRHSYNIPLEISLYLSSYVAALQSRKVVDVPTTTVLMATITQLHRYSVHLWAVTVIYCLALPCQIWSTLKWVTIPATVVASFIFFGFLVAGEEIESYDKNDLNMDHFVHDIIRKMLAVTRNFVLSWRLHIPDPSVWAFSEENDLFFASSDAEERVSPSEWVQRGIPKMRDALRRQ
ncbi:hypothetical protein BDR07DRAFT_1453030 [Suillus spraguei]|nr:hypothetical protein BDR07DRAFT_1453030 [Suillus spraguei]